MGAPVDEMHDSVSKKPSEASTMTEENIKAVLTSVKKGTLSVDDGLMKLKHLPFEDVGFARIDHHRTLRQGFPEVIFGQGQNRPPDSGHC